MIVVVSSPLASPLMLLLTLLVSTIALPSSPAEEAVGDGWGPGPAPHGSFHSPGWASIRTTAAA
jgi:hypothetical protein